MASPEPPSRALDEWLRAASDHAPARPRAKGQSRDAVQLGRYVVEKRIGAGSSGVVYRAFDPKNDRRVALKLLHAVDAGRYEAARDRLLREAQALAKLSHPNVLRVFDVGTYDPAVFDPSPARRFGMRRDDEGMTHVPGVYLATELLEGRSLDRWLRRRHRSWPEIRDVFIAAGRGLAAAHARKLVHRDFKPANVMIGTDGHVCVVDFGLVRQVAPHGSESSLRMSTGAKQRLQELARPIDANLTVTGALVGTPAYMAPEQRDRIAATARSDQYSFCLMLYEACYRHRPFIAQTEAELRRLERNGAPLPPPHDTDAPSWCYPILRRGLSARPFERFESMDALLDALEHPTKYRLVRHKRTIAVGLGLGLALGAAGWLAARSTDDCDATAWSAAWGPDQRRALRDHAGQDPQVYVSRATERAIAGFDQHAAEGRALERSACRADVDHATTACLGRTLEAFEAIVGATTTADGPGLLHTAEQLRHWPGPGACREGLGSPARIELEQAWKWQLLGDDARALEHARRAHARANDEGDTPLRLDAAVALGLLAQRTGQLPEAEPALTEALWSGESMNRPRLTAHAAIALLKLSRSVSQPPADTMLWTRIAREHSTRSDVPAQLRLRLQLELARHALVNGNAEQAASALRRGLEQEVDVSAAAWVFEARELLANLEQEQGNEEAAAALRKTAEQDALAHLGRGHPALGR